MSDQVRSLSTIIEPSSGWANLELRDLWGYRELLYFLVWRDVKVRYKQTVLGAAWAILQPLLTMAVFTVFFGRLAGVGSEGLPYPIFSFAGLLPWTFFALGVTQSANSLVGSTNLITKVYFPRLLIPTSSILSGLVDLGLAFIVLLGMMVFYGIPVTAWVLLAPALAFVAAICALGVGLWLAALNVEYRDVRYVVPFFVQLWLFVTPVIYPTSRVTDKLGELGLPAWLYGLNPMVGVVQGFRWAVLGAGSPPGALFAVSLLACAVVFASGVVYFRRMERTFADVI